MCLWLILSYGECTSTTKDGIKALVQYGKIKLDA